MSRIRSLVRDLRSGVIEQTPHSYMRAATARLSAARRLDESGEPTHALDVIYLAGYAVECALKALILERTPRPKWADVCREIATGERGHDIGFLARVLRVKSPIPDAVREDLNLIGNEWITDLRYAARLIPTAEAQSLLEAVSRFVDWVERSR